MFHPVGNQPPSVYWRRRLVVIGSVALLLVLIVLTVRTLASNDSTPAAGATDSTSPRPSVSSPAPPVSTPVSTSAAASTPGSTSAASRPASTSAAPARCAPAHLVVSAAVGSPTYHVGDHPVVELQVVNAGPGPCVQDLADKQIELKVYNGESRVWGSHDCQVQPGTTDRVLVVGRPVVVSIPWSGYTSQPNCAGTRQRVGAGTYTLYATLSGKTGKAAQFAIS